MMKCIILPLFAISSLFAIQVGANPECFDNSGRQRQIFADSEDCHYYYHCQYLNETAAVAIKQPCPNGTFFHDVHLQCVPEQSTTPCMDMCRDEVISMIGCYSGETCGSFFVCSNEISYPMCCPPFTSFNMENCQCVADENCNDQQCPKPEQPTTTPKPSEHVNNTMCRDSQGNYLKPVPGLTTAFEIVDLEDSSNSKVQFCAPGTAFTVFSCACDLVMLAPVSNERKCSLYLPFDGDAADDSHFHAYTQIVGDAEVSWVHYARGSASLKTYGGWLEVPAFQNYDFTSASSFCFFYRCGLDPTNQTQCTTSGGILSNSNADSSQYTFSIGSVATDRIETRLGFKQPALTATVDADVEFVYNPNDPTNDFQQVCVVHGDYMTSIYVNNELVSTMGTSNKLASGRMPFTIGSDPFFGNFYGYIDEVLFCDFALTPEEVSSHYQGNDALVDAGLIPEANRRSPKKAPVYEDVDTEWLKWAEKYNHDPNDLEAKERFAKTLEEIKEHNKLYEQGLVPEYKILTKFAAEKEEDLELFFGLQVPLDYKGKDDKPRLQNLNCDNLPNHFDWCESGACGEPIDQGKCGSCYAISAAAAIQGQLRIHDSNNIRLSIQQLLECSKGFGNNGCRGGLMTNAFKYLSTVAGLASWDNYPYTYKDTDQCSTKNFTQFYGGIFNYAEYNQIDECSLAYTLMTVGPLCFGFEVHMDFMNNPSGKIYRTEDCVQPKAMLNHAMVIVGFGKDEKTGQKYWKIKNSWGDKWCEGGYIRVAREDSKVPCMCGICDLVSAPVVLVKHKNRLAGTNEQIKQTQWFDDEIIDADTP